MKLLGTVNVVLEVTDRLLTKVLYSIDIGEKREYNGTVHQLFIQSVTGPHRQNDRDERPCREDHFL